MYSVLKSYGLNGLNGFAVAVEADVSGGSPELERPTLDLPVRDFPV